MKREPMDINIMFTFSLLFGGIASLQSVLFMAASTEEKLLEIKRQYDHRIREDLQSWASKVAKDKKVDENLWKDLMTVIALYNEIKDVDTKVDSNKRNSGFGIMASVATAILALMVNVHDVFTLFFGWLAFISGYLLFVSISSKVSIYKGVKKLTEPLIFKET